MKDIRFNIRLYIIIPIIFAGISILSSIAIYNVVSYYTIKESDPIWPAFFWGGALALVTLLIGLIISRTLLSPLEILSKKAEELGVLQNVLPPDHKLPGRDEIGRFTWLFDQVTELLSKVDAKALFPTIAGQSRAIRSVFNHILKVAPTDSTVLVMGETGTGKELIAKSIFEHSKRKDRPFITINCAAIPEGLLESELFGYEKGAFTGATQRKLGKFESANRGTIFMDEIGDMPLPTQAKLLRVLQEHQFERLGGVKPIDVDIRFIAATNKDLGQMVKNGSFREDLYFRLNVFSIYLPPLRERREDVPLLVYQFIKESGRHVDVSSDCMQLLSSYNWPGNIRELKNAIESALVLSESTLEIGHLPSSITSKWQKIEQESLASHQNQSLDHRLQELEKGILIEALTRTGGIQKNAAKLLGIKERSLWHRVKKYQIDVSSFKESL